MSLEKCWVDAQSKIKEKIGETPYQTWFANLKAVDEQGMLSIQAPDEFFKNWIVEHYERLIKDSVEELFGQPINLSFSVGEQIINHIHPTTEIKKEPQKPNPLQQQKLNDRFTFNNFVIGNSNRFACAASLAVAEAPAKAYNPLFIYGHVGLGKTHLIQSITHKIKELFPEKKIQYLTSEQFTNELINAIRHRSTEKFRNKYRKIDILLIDDIHFIAGKESTQEEFFHTFNALHESQKQIIITSDRPPKEISNLEERLSSRFAWGLITDIQPPDYETRVAILKKKMELENVSVSDEIIFFIADQIKTNIRELEGALIRVTAFARLENKPLTLESAKLVLRDMVRETKKIISVEMIQENIANHFNLPVSELIQKKRSKNLVVPRQIAMYLTRKFTSLSLPEIGNAFGGRDHTTVMHACKKIEQEKQKPEFNNIVQLLTDKIQQ